MQVHAVVFTQCSQSTLTSEIFTTNHDKSWQKNGSAWSCGRSEGCFCVVLRVVVFCSGICLPNAPEGEGAWRDQPHHQWRLNCTFWHLNWRFCAETDGFILMKWWIYNQKVAFVGKSGGGKSTMVHLLMRFYDPSRGTIKLDSRGEESKIKMMRIVLHLKTRGIVHSKTRSFVL